MPSSVYGAKASYDMDNLGGGTPFPSAPLLDVGSGATFAGSSIAYFPLFGTNMAEVQGSTSNSSALSRPLVSHSPKLILASNHFNVLAPT